MDELANTGPERRLTALVVSRLSTGNVQHNGTGDTPCVAGPVVGYRRRASDVSPVLTADLEEGLGDLLERADPCSVHELGEDVLP